MISTLNKTPGSTFFPDTIIERVFFGDNINFS